jgi:hypothetical protein
MPTLIVKTGLQATMSSGSKRLAVLTMIVKPTPPRVGARH